MNRLETLGWAVLASEELRLGPWEARILSHLALIAPGRPATHAALMDLVHVKRQNGAGPDSRRVAKAVGRIRDALADVGFSRATIQTVPEVGYQIAPDAAALLVNAVIEPSAWGIAA